MDYKYDLTFYEALELVLKDECWVQGESFLDGTVLMLKDECFVAVKDFNTGDVWNPFISRNLVQQKFRKVFTQPSAERRV